MTTDIFTISLCAALLLLAFVPPLFNPFFRKIKTKENGEEGDNGKQQQLPPISIVITAHDSAPELRTNLPLILNQQYPAGVQVIVVAERGDSETEDVLKLISAENERLYYTLIPESSRYMSRKKLAMTIGVKAAKHEWVMLTEPSYAPVSDQWLATMARNCQNDIDIVTGYSNFDNDAPLYCRFERLQTECYQLRETQKHIAYRHFGANLLIRKSIFMDNEGFRGNLNLVRGEYDFIVNKFGTAENTATEISPEAWLREKAPTHKAWKYRHMYYLETRKLLERSFRHRLVFNFDQTMLHIPFIIMVSAIAVAAVMKLWIIMGAAITSLLINTIIRSIFLSKKAKMFGEKTPAILALPLQLAVIWHNLHYSVQHRLADKLDFTTHKL